MAEACTLPLDTAAHPPQPRRPVPVRLSEEALERGSGRHMIGEMLRFAGELAYRAGLGPEPSVDPDQGLVELVEGARLRPGRALDLGCGTGRNAIYLARHGWDVTGIDMVGRALTLTRRSAAAAGVQVRVVEGDVTRLSELDIGGDYSLLVDTGCYHMVPVSRRDAYAAGVSAVAVPGAVLLIVGFLKVLGIGMSAEELLPRFGGWELVRAAPVPGEEMRRSVRRPALIRAAIGRGWFEPLRYESGEREHG